MLVSFTRSASLLCALSVASLLLQYPLARSAVAQPAADHSHRVVEVPIAQLNEIQEELQYLRARDAERQAWEDSIMHRLPPTSFDLVSERNMSGGQGTPHLPTSEACQESNCAGTSCNCSCRCYPCQCPLPQSPCIDCPRARCRLPLENDRPLRSDG